MHLILSLILLVVCSGNAFCQMRSPAGCECWQHVVDAICANDTATAMQRLDQLNQQWPDTALSAWGYLEAGRLYLAVNRKADAKKSFLNGLATNYRSLCFWQTDSSCRANNSNGIMQWKSRSVLFIELSKMSRREGDPVTAIKYLHKADSTYARYSGCGTCIVKMQSVLNLERL